VFAAGDGGLTGVAVGGYHPDRKPFIYVEFTSSAWGGRPAADGLDGIANMLSNVTSPSVEVTEAEQPLQVQAVEFLTDRAGPGKHRGGTAIRRAYRFLGEEATLQLRSDRRAHTPYGLAGGANGAPSRTYMCRSGELAPMESKFTAALLRNDEFAHETAGGGGWGDPFDRDPDAVLADVRRGFVSAEAARRDYGVVVAGRTLDVAATSGLRARRRAAAD
jgi:N-methylhydantoinase B